MAKEIEYSFITSGEAKSGLRSIVKSAIRSNLVCQSVSKDEIEMIAAKLLNEGLTKDNYSTDGAEAILYNCVSPNALKKLLAKCEPAVFDLLP